MTSKMISIREEVYNNLKKLKGSSESFSDLIERLIKSQEKDPLKHFGIGKKLPEEILEDFEKIVNEARKENAKGASKKILEL